MLPVSDGSSQRGIRGAGFLGARSREYLVAIDDVLPIDIGVATWLHGCAESHPSIDMPERSSCSGAELHRDVELDLY